MTMHDLTSSHVAKAQALAAETAFRFIKRKLHVDPTLAAWRIDDHGVWVPCRMFITWSEINDL